MYWTLEAAEAFGTLYAQRVARARKCPKPRARTRSQAPNAMAISLMLHAAVIAWIVALVPIRPFIPRQTIEPSAPVAVVFAEPHHTPTAVQDASSLWAPREDVVVETADTTAPEATPEAPPQIQPTAEPEPPAFIVRPVQQVVSASKCFSKDSLRVISTRVPHAAAISRGSGQSDMPQTCASVQGASSTNGPAAKPNLGSPTTKLNALAVPVHANKGVSREVEPLAGNPTPDYPALARRKGLEGLVIVFVEVLESGRTGVVRLGRSSGHTVLDQVAVACAKRWRFKPSLRAGEAVRCEVEVPFQFELITARR